MLYQIGVILMLFSVAFCGGSVLVPVTMAAVGVMLMRLGRRSENGKQDNTERQDPVVS